MQSLLALADPTRRRMVELLAVRERTAGELVGEFKLSAPAISQHLNVLREAGLVTTRAAGQSRIQTLNPAGFGDLEDWLERTRSVWSRRLDALERELRAEDAAAEPEAEGEIFIMKSNDQPGQFTGPAEVRIGRTLPGPIERIWEYLIDPEKRSRWFAGGPMEPRAGGKFTLHFRHKDLAPDETPPEAYQQHHETGHSMEGLVTRFEPPRVLAYTFGSDRESEVTFELTPQGKDVLLVLTHRSRDGDLPYMAEFGAGWHAHCSLLIALLEGAPRPPFWPVYLGLKAEYEKRRLIAQKS